jgi:hypothetical protein
MVLHGDLAITAGELLSYRDSHAGDYLNPIPRIETLDWREESI